MGQNDINDTLCKQGPDAVRARHDAAPEYNGWAPVGAKSEAAPACMEWSGGSLSTNFILVDGTHYRKRLNTANFETAKTLARSHVATLLSEGRLRPNSSEKGKSRFGSLLRSPRMHSLRKAVFLTSLRVRCSHAAAPSIEGQTFKSSHHARPFSSSAVAPPTRPFCSRRSWGGTHEMRCLERTVRFHFPLTSRSRLPALPATPCDTFRDTA